MRHFRWAIVSENIPPICHLSLELALMAARRHQLYFCVFINNLTEELCRKESSFFKTNRSNFNSSILVPISAVYNTIAHRAFHREGFAYVHDLVSEKAVLSCNSYHFCSSNFKNVGMNKKNAVRIFCSFEITLKNMFVNSIKIRNALLKLFVYLSFPL